MRSERSRLNDYTPIVGCDERKAAGEQERNVQKRAVLAPANEKGEASQQGESLVKVRARGIINY
jgi:hypothetical protein